MLQHFKEVSVKMTKGHLYTALFDKFKQLSVGSSPVLNRENSKSIPNQLLMLSIPFFFLPQRERHRALSGDQQK